MTGRLLPLVSPIPLLTTGRSEKATIRVLLSPTKENENWVLSTMPFDFHPFIRRYPKDLPKPRMLIRVVTPKAHVEGLALIDSGANGCYLPRSFAKVLKINWRKGTKIKVYDATDKRRLGYEHFLTVKFYGTLLDSPDNVLFTDDLVLVLEETPVTFLRHLREPILGVKGFLDRYIYTLNHIRQRFSVLIPDKGRACEICKP
jgi:hypothetical protein